MPEIPTPYPVLGREPAEDASTFALEIVTCRMPDASVRKLLVKHGGAHEGPSWAHRGGVPYEAEVYRQVLAPLAVSVPRIHATTSTSSETFLWMEYLEDAREVSHAGLAALHAAAAWIGDFHRRNESRTVELAGLLRRYDLAYYTGWARRTRELSARMHLSWLPAVCAAFDRLAPELADAAPTVIHGEYYPPNILVRHGGPVTPIDWESAAIAPGEIDLASLIEGWSDEDSRACQAAYQKARWPDGAPEGFARRLQLSCLYLKLRWLGDATQWEEHENPREQLQLLEAFARNMGLLGSRS